MQEAGVPVTFAYVSDAHDFHGVSGNDHRAYGPGEAGYVQQLKDYDTAFGKFFTAPEERRHQQGQHAVRDHRRGGRPLRRHARRTPACDGVTTPCTYANGHVTEVNGDLRRLVTTYNASHGTNATTNFSVHADMAPNVYITGNPARDSATARDLEKAFADMQVVEPAHAARSRACSWRWPTRSRRSCSTWSRPTRRERRRSRRSRRATTSSTRRRRTRRRRSARTTTSSNCVFLPNVTPPNQTFAWNHGGIQPEVASTWVGLVGPGDRGRARTWTTTSSRITPTSGRRCSRCSG